MSVLLSVHDLKTYFPLKKPHPFAPKSYLKANDGISLSIERGETYGLVGESGSGKSTLGRSLLQLVRPTAGEVLYYGNGGVVDLVKAKGEKLRKLRKELQIVFQDPYSSLNPRMTAGQIIEEGVRAHRLFSDREERRKYTVELMRKCGLEGYAAGKYPHQFSGGQRQRIGIARALAVKPKFIVCDECVSALDVSVQAQILNLLSKLKREENLTYLFISHDLSVVRYISDKIAVMYLGRIVEKGSAEQVFEAPLHPYTKTLLLAGEDAPAPIEPKGRGNAEGGCPFYPRCFRAKESCQCIPAPLEEKETGHFAACRFPLRGGE